MKSCDVGTTCAVVKDDGTTGCVPVGPAQAGDACNTVHCGEGLTCLGKPGARQCYKICELERNNCSANTSCKGSALLFTDPKFGICQ
jgi:hypothetical protein